MLGLDDFRIWSAFVLIFLSAVACAVYGIINWNNGGEEAVTPEDTAWEKEEREVEEAL